MEAKAAGVEESPWRPLSEDDADTEPVSIAPESESAATSYPPPPIARAPEQPKRVKAARIIKAKSVATARPDDDAQPDGAPDSVDEFEEETTPVSPPPPAVQANPADTAPELTESDSSSRVERVSLSSAEELTDDDIAPDSMEDVEVDLSDTADPAAESAEASTPRPPPPPRRSAFDEARRVAKEKADARRVADEARKVASEDPSRRQRRAWWEEIFGEDYARASDTLSPSQVVSEVNFMEESLGVAKGGVVLDLACGAGHHAVELAARGYGVVGYDLSLYQLALAADVAQQASQKLNLLQGDMREMAFEETFDGVVCWNTSFGYFEEEKNANVAQRVFRALRPGGMFLLDVVNRDFVTAHQPSQTWFEGDACVCMDDMNVDFITSRMRVKRSLILDDGRSMECSYSVRLYGLHELGKLLHDVGFRITEASGHPSTPGVFFGASSPRIIILAQRP